VEIEEVNMGRDCDIAELKALATAVRVKERRPYGRFAEERHRLASFCATGNQMQFLTDDTGNRRWLCHKVSNIDDPREWTLDYDQLYAQLHHEFSQGFRYWFNLNDQRRVERQNRPFTLVSDEEQLISTRFRMPVPGEPVKLMNAATICQLLNGGRIGGGLSSRKVSNAMVRMGYKCVHSKSGNYYKVFEIPYNQIQSNLSYGISENADSQSVPAEGDLPF